MNELDAFPDSKLECLRSLLAETREELDRVDRKANTLFAVFTVFVSAVVAGMIAGSWDPTKLSRAWLQAGWWTGAGVVVYSLLVLLKVVAPQHIHPISDNRGQIRFFGDVAAFPNKAEFISHLREASLDEGDRVADQVWVLSRFVASKYRRMAVAVTTHLVGLGVVAACLAWEAVT